MAQPAFMVTAGADIRRAFETLDEHVGGTANVQLLVRGRAGDGLGTGMRDLETLQALEKIERTSRLPSSEAGRIIGSSVSLWTSLRKVIKRLQTVVPMDIDCPTMTVGLLTCSSCLRMPVHRRWGNL